MATQAVELKAVGFLDGEGVVQMAVVQYLGDMVTLGGYNEQGEYVSFEAEAYHLCQWCEDVGFTYMSGSREVDFELN